MNPITREEILLPHEFEKVRPEALRRIIALKKIRRVPLGDKMSLVFENRDTMWFQVQEMVRVERMEDPAQIQEELDVYNALLPDRGQLSATLFIEITDPERMLQELERFLGIEEDRRVYLEYQPGPRVYGKFDLLYRNPEKVSSVYFLKFDIPEAMREKTADPDTALHLVVDHPNYYARTQLSMELRHQLGEELIG